MKVNLAFALISIGVFCFLGPMPAQARGGGHGGNSGSHAASQNHAAAGKSQSKTKKGQKEPYLKYELKNGTVSAAKAKSSKVKISPIHINKKIDKSSP